MTENPTNNSALKFSLIICAVTVLDQSQRSTSLSLSSSLFFLRTSTMFASLLVLFFPSFALCFRLSISSFIFFPCPPSPHLFHFCLAFTFIDMSSVSLPLLASTFLLIQPIVRILHLFRSLLQLSVGLLHPFHSLPYSDVLFSSAPLNFSASYFFYCSLLFCSTFPVLLFSGFVSSLGLRWKVSFSYFSVLFMSFFSISLSLLFFHLRHPVLEFILQR